MELIWIHNRKSLLFIFVITLPHMLFQDKKFRNTNIAGIFFPVQVHADTWGATNPSHPLHIGRFNNCTFPMFDRVKGIHMPSRIQHGTVSTHSMKALPGFKRYFPSL